MWTVSYDEAPWRRDDLGEVILDAIEYRVAYFKTKPEAECFAKEKAPGSFFGVVNVVEIRRTSIAEIKADEECELQWWQDADGKLWTEVGETEEVCA